MRRPPGFRESLPIDAALPAFVEAVATSRAAVLRAPTGAGKTTRVAPALLDAGLGGRSIVLVEPRRMAARAAARRMAFERGGEVGGEIGYRVRFDAKTSRATRIVVVTVGVLVRRLQDDPFLEGVGAVVFDEVHERGLDADLALAMIAKIRRDVRDDLVVVAMSATVDPAPIAAFLAPCPVIESEGRLYPVDVRHAAPARDESLERTVARAVRDLLGTSTGDVLVFLPGVGEIRRARTAVAALCAERATDVVELYGDLPPERQDQALSRGARRRVVLATNVAESSVTVEGVDAVVDSGLARVLRLDPSSGLDRLEVTRISRTSADQRAGRAGRTAPGVCVRLWGPHEDASLREADEPEIRRVDLSRAVLELRAWGETSLGDFPWLEAPDPAALDRADELLALLGAVDVSGVTEIGHTMVRLPVPVRVARMLVEGARLGCARRVALAAALLSERDPFRRRVTEGSRLPAAGGTESDVLDRLVVLESLDRASASRSAAPRWPELDVGAARFVLAARDQLYRIVRGARERPCDDERSSRPGDRRGQTVATSACVDQDAAVLRAILAAYPDRVAVRRDRASPRALMSGGRGVRLAGESTVATAELFVCVDVDAGRRGERSEALVRRASAIEREWLPPHAIASETVTFFDESRRRVTAARRTRYRDLVLEERGVTIDDEDEAARVLADAAARDLDRALRLDDPELATLRARVALLAEHMPELGIPAFDAADVATVLPALCAGRRSFEDLRGAPLADFLSARLDPRQRAALDRHAPERLEVPSGSRVRLVYEVGRPPVLAARIQELFGLAETPRVAGGRVPVLVHLLGPNGRPQQVTDDLASFWTTTYAEVRSALRRRYPKHAWPEDPWNAPAERRPRRRK